MLSINQKAIELVRKLIAAPTEYGVNVTETKLGATIIDAGISARGGFKAGRLITEICMGGLGKARIFPKRYGKSELPTIFVCTDHPALSTLGSQFAGWQVKKDDFFAIGSGPARALALKPRHLYDLLSYKDKADVAVIVLETSKYPPEDVIQEFCSECKLPVNKMTIILVPTTSIAGSTQVSGRIVETGLHKLHKLGIAPLSIRHAWGYAPIAPIHRKFSVAMGRTNDVILYGGTTFYALEHDSDSQLKDVLKRAPSSASRQYGKPFREIFADANNDFYQIDPNLFAPAVFVVNNITSGRTFEVGEVNVEILRDTLGISAF